MSATAARRFRDRFELQRILGKGGMGEVFLALDAFTQRQVAVKTIQLAMLEDPEIGPRARKLWLNETRLAGRLRHPNIVEVFEAGVADGQGYLVMEYVDGGTLHPHSRPDGLLPIERVVEILYRVCNALDYANRQGLLHRDVKPANVMIGSEGTVKVTDFGTCYLMNSDETQVFDVGTLPYMPPEHFRRRPPTLQSDIYAVGVMAYQLLSGALPFAADSYEDMIQKKLADDFVPLEARRQALPQELRFAVHRAMHGSTGIRYASWAEFCDQLAIALPEVHRRREIAFEAARFSTLRKLAFFAEFTDAQLWEAVHLSRWHEMPAGKRLFECGDPGSAVYVLSEGRISVSRDGKELNQVAAGDCLGELAYLDEARPLRSAAATALTPGLLVEFDAQMLRDASAGLQAAFVKAFVGVLVGRLRRADERFLSAIGGA